MSPDLVGPVERREEHRVLERVHRRERLAVADDELADRRQALVLEDLLEELEGLPPDAVRLEVVRLLDELRLALGLLRVDELRDLDRADGLERELLEVLVVDHDVLVRRVLVALHGLRALDDLLVLGAPDLHLDPRLVLLVEHVEAHAGPRFRGQVELDRDGHEAELDGPFPHGARHRSSSLGGSLLAASGRRLYHRTARTPVCRPRDRRPPQAGQSQGGGEYGARAHWRCVSDPSQLPTPPMTRIRRRSIPVQLGRSMRGRPRGACRGPSRRSRTLSRCWSAGL